MSLIQLHLGTSMLWDFFKCQHWWKSDNRVKSYREEEPYKPTWSLDKVDTIKSRLILTQPNACSVTMNLFHLSSHLLWENLALILLYIKTVVSFG